MNLHNITATALPIDLLSLLYAAIQEEIPTKNNLPSHNNHI